MIRIGNAFSAGMLAGDAVISFRRVTAEEIRAMLTSAPSWESCVGHADTALLISTLLDLPIEMHRASTELRNGDTLIIAQYNGPRLPERATTLPDGATIRWIIAHVERPMRVSIEGGAIAVHPDAVPHDSGLWAVIVPDSGEAS